jgi:hypothetical protein
MTMSFIAGVPLQSCIRGVPKKPEFMKIREGSTMRVTIGNVQEESTLDVVG